MELNFEMIPRMFLLCKWRVFHRVVKERRGRGRKFDGRSISSNLEGKGKEGGKEQMKKLGFSGYFYQSLSGHGWLCPFKVVNTCASS